MGRVEEELPCTNCDIIARSVERLFEFSSPELRRAKVIESVNLLHANMAELCKTRVCKRTVLPPIQDDQL